MWSQKYAKGDYAWPKIPNFGKGHMLRNKVA